MPRLSRATWIAEHDRYAQRRHDDFRRAALAVATAFAERPEVRAVSLFGSVARPLETFITSRRHWELLHDPKDVDLAVWIDRLDDLKGLQRARSAALNRLLETEQIGVAHHQVDVFLFEPGSDAYLGRLCGYGVCPKRKAGLLDARLWAPSLPQAAQGFRARSRRSGSRPRHPPISRGRRGDGPG